MYQSETQSNPKLKEYSISDIGKTSANSDVLLSCDSDVSITSKIDLKVRCSGLILLRFLLIGAGTAFVTYADIQLTGHLKVQGSVEVGSKVVTPMMLPTE